MRNKKSIILFLLILTTFSPVFVSNSEFLEANALIEFPKISTNNDNKSIILMIGDGMGHEHLKLAKWVELGKQGSLSLEKLPFVNNVTTYCADTPITDSAAAATAMATGHKTNYLYVSVLPNLESVETIVEKSQKKREDDWSDYNNRSNPWHTSSFYDSCIIKISNSRDY